MLIQSNILSFLALSNQAARGRNHASLPQPDGVSGQQRRGQRSIADTSLQRSGTSCQGAGWQHRETKHAPRCLEQSLGLCRASVQARLYSFPEIHHLENPPAVSPATGALREWTQLLHGLRAAFPEGLFHGKGLWGTQKTPPISLCFLSYLPRFSQLFGLRSLHTASTPSQPLKNCAGWGWAEELQNREKAPFLGLLPIDSMPGTAKKTGSQMHHFWRQQSLWWHSQPCFWPCSLAIYLLVKPFAFAYRHAARIHFPASLAVGCGHKTELRTTDYGVDVCHSTRSGPLALAMKSLAKNYYSLSVNTQGNLGRDIKMAEITSASIPEWLHGAEHIFANMACWWRRNELLLVIEVNNDSSKYTSKPVRALSVSVMTA